MCQHAWATQAMFITINTQAQANGKLGNKKETEAKTVTKLSSGQTYDLTYLVLLLRTYVKNLL